MIPVRARRPPAGSSSCASSLLARRGLRRRCQRRHRARPVADDRHRPRGDRDARSSRRAPSRPLPAAAYPLTLTDDEGTEVVTIPARPERIVSLTPATTEILFAVGAGSRVVGGTPTPTTSRPAAKQITQVVKLGGVDIEKIVGLGADLVDRRRQRLQQPRCDREAPRRSGSPCVVVYAPDVAGVFRDIELVGAAAGEPAAGAALVGAHAGADRRDRRRRRLAPARRSPARLLRARRDQGRSTRSPTGSSRTS